MTPKRRWLVGVWSLLGAACSKDPRLGPLLPPCTASANAINLDTAAYLAIDPESAAGSIARYAAVSKLIALALAVQGGSNGPSRGSLLHAAPSSDHTPTSHRRFGVMRVLRRFPGPAERPAQADRPCDFVHSYHRHDQGLEGDPPLRERPPGEPRQRQRRSRLRYEP